MTEVSTYETKMADLESEQLDSQEREVCEQMQVLQRKLEMIRAERSRLRNNRQNLPSSQGSVSGPTMNQAISKKTTAPINKSKRGSIFSSLNPFKSAAKTHDKKNGDQDSVVSVSSITSTQSSTVTSKSGRSSRCNHHESPEHKMVSANNRRFGANVTLHDHHQGHHPINRARRGGVHRSASQQEMRRQIVPSKNHDLQANVVHGKKHENENEQGFGTPTSQRNQGPNGGSQRKAQRSHSMTPIRSNHSRSRQVMDQETESYRPGVLVSHQPRQASKERHVSFMPKQQQTVQKPVPPPMQMPSKLPRGVTMPNQQQQTVQKPVPPPVQMPSKQPRGSTKPKPQQPDQKPVPPPMPMPTNFLSELKAKAGSGLKKTEDEKQVQSPQSGQKAAPRPKTMPTNFLDELKGKASGGGFDLKKIKKQPQSGRNPSPMAARPVSLLDELKAKSSTGRDGFGLKKVGKQVQTRRQSLPAPKKAGPVSLLDELKMKTSRGGGLKKTEVPVKPTPSTGGNSILAQLQRNKTFAAKLEQKDDWS